MKSETQNTEENLPPIYDRSECDSIERCPHDNENPYVLINNKVLRDSSISPECRWLIAYLLTNDKGWKISRQQVVNHLKGIKGRDSTWKLFEEAIEAGYLKRIEIRVKNPKGGYLKGARYVLSETPKFKKCYRTPENQTSGGQGTKKEQGKEETIVLSCVEASPVAQPSTVENSKTVKKDFKGLDVVVSKEDLYSQCVLQNKDWTAPEIEEAWKILDKYQSPVRDWFSFVEGTIKNIRKTSKIKELKEQTEWQKKPKSNTPISKNPSENTNSKTSEPVMLGHHLVDWRQHAKPVTKL